ARRGLAKSAPEADRPRALAGQVRPQREADPRAPLAAASTAEAARRPAPPGSKRPALGRRFPVPLSRYRQVWLPATPRWPSPPEHRRWLRMAHRRPCPPAYRRRCPMVLRRYRPRVRRPPGGPPGGSAPTARHWEPRARLAMPATGALRSESTSVDRSSALEVQPALPPAPAE